MRESMARLTPRFSATRTVREYTEQHYLPAAAAYRQRIADKGAIGRQVVDWRRAVEHEWGSLRFGNVRVETAGNERVVEVELVLNGLDANTVSVELFADAIDGGDPVRQEMSLERTLTGEPSRGVYRATIPTTRPQNDYTARVTPRHPGVAVPLEFDQILWQR
jgi:starch phosphorylase